MIYSAAVAPRTMKAWLSSILGAWPVYSMGPAETEAATAV